MIFTDFQFLEHKICINKISVPFTGPLSVTIGQKRIWFRGEGHRSIADRRLHMFNKNFKIHKILYNTKIAQWYIMQESRISHQYLEK